MKISFVASEGDPLKARIEFHCENEDDTLLVKSLPGRFYYDKKKIWVVPISVGLAMELEKHDGFLNNSILALVQEQEKTLLYSLTAPAPSLTIAQMDKIKIDEAILKAYDSHYWREHKGSEKDYFKNHPETLLTPEAGPGKRKKKTEREIKNEQIKNGRLD